MNNILMNMLNINLMASMFIVVVLIFRKIFKKAPKVLFMLMWAAVALRLLCPVTVNTKFGLLPERIVDRQERVAPVEMRSEEPSERQIAYVFMGNEDYKLVRNEPVRPIAKTPSDVAPKTSEPVAVTTEKVSETVAAEPVAAPAEPIEVEAESESSISIAAILMAAYAAGVLGMIAYGAVAYVKVRRSCAAMIPVARGSNIYICDEIRTGFIIGIFRPKIVLPSGLDRRTCEHVLNHEKTHLRHRDNLWKPLGYIVLALNWFNPFVWLAYINFVKDMELFCDEDVIKKYNNSQICEYSVALLNLSIERMSMASLAFGEVNVKERIKSITTYKKPALVFASAATVISLVLTGCFVTNARAEQKEEPAETTVEETEIAPSEESVEETAADAALETTVETTEEYEDEAYEYYSDVDNWYNTTTTDPDPYDVEYDGTAMIFEYDKQADNYKVKDGSDEYIIDVAEDGGKITISVNGRSETLDSLTCFKGLDSAYLLKKDNCTFILTEPTLEENTGIEIYKLDGDKITYVNRYLCIMLDCIIASADDFLISESHFTGPSINCINHFTIDRDGNLVPLSDVWTFSNDSYQSYKYKEDISGKVVINGEVTDTEKIAKAGTFVKTVATDRKSYVDYETEDGNIIRVDCSAYAKERANEDYEDEWGFYENHGFCGVINCDIGGGPAAVITAQGEYWDCGN